MLLLFFFFKQKTAYELRSSDWSSDVCSSDLVAEHRSTGLRHYHMSALTMMLCNFDQYDGGSEQNHERQRGRDHDERAALGAECQIHQGKADIEIGRASCRERVCQYV